MRILVCIDDTDNLDSRGTGDLASSLTEHLESSRWGQARYITRHQLLVHPDIPYTSHNSSMAFEAQIDDSFKEALISYCSRYLADESAPGSDPGLCVVNLDQLTRPDALINFGYRAKNEVLTKDEAYQLAQKLGVHLSEHGGTGHGVIGALAGTGLRLGGNDGRLKGQLKFKGGKETISVGTLLKHPCVDVVRTEDGQCVAEGELVNLVDKVKTVLLNGLSVLLVQREQDVWQNLSRRQLKQY